MAELIDGLVDREADIAGRHFAEDSARRPAVDRMEIVAVLDLGDVGVAEPLEVGLDHRLLLLARHGEGDVMGNALREYPRTLLHVRLMQEVDGLLRAALVDVEAGVGAFGSDFREAESVYEKALLLLQVAHRHDDAVEPANRDIVGDLRRRPA